ncbi:hypothetical protein ACHAWT_004530 [Skeletonema menzelii]
MHLMITTMAARWIIYSLLLLLRFYGSYYNSLSGYIHPDEFFQGGQELFFGCQQRQQPDSKTAAFDDVELSRRREAEHKHPVSHKYVVHNIPWEYEPKNAIRSIVPPAFMTLLPLRVYSVLRSITSSGDNRMDCTSSVDNDVLMKQLSGVEILIIPRLFMTLLSLIFLDGCLWILVNSTTQPAKDTTTNNGQSSSNIRVGPPIEVIVLASSWPMLVMTTRPFTNTLEAMVISLLLLIVAMDHHQSSISNKNDKNKISNQCKTPLLIGMICSIGLFVRFTFAFFALPIVLLFLFNRWHTADNRWRNIGWNLLSLALSFLTTSLLFVTTDWYYYHYHSPGRDADVTICNNWSCYRDAFVATVSEYVVPWNAFRYNSKAANLAEHGLHPRITHMLVNMPMMFGPLTLVGYFSCIKTRRKKYASSFAETCFGRVLCQSTIISGLLVLSCAPHQEPRFILPCIVPLVVLYGRNVVGMDNLQTNPKKRVILTTTWVLFNSILYIFFGWLHQGGLVQSLLHLPPPVNPNERSPETVIYYKTYMPPTFLTRGRSQEENMEKGSTCIANDERRRVVSGEGDILLACDNQIIIDLQGREAEELPDVLHERLPCDQRNEESLLLVTSVPVMISLAEKKWTEYKFLSVHGHRTHVSTEDWPFFNDSFKSFFDQMELVTYHISCTAEV